MPPQDCQGFMIFHLVEGGVGANKALLGNDERLSVKLKVIRVGSMGALVCCLIRYL